MYWRSCSFSKEEPSTAIIRLMRNHAPRMYMRMKSASKPLPCESVTRYMRCVHPTPDQTWKTAMKATYTLSNGEVAGGLAKNGTGSPPALRTKKGEWCGSEWWWPESMHVALAGHCRPTEAKREQTRPSASMRSSVASSHTALHGPGLSPMPARLVGRASKATST